MKSFSTITLLATAGLAPAVLALPHQPYAAQPHTGPPHGGRSHVGRSYGGKDHAGAHYSHHHEDHKIHSNPNRRTVSGTIALDSHVEYSSSTGVIGCLINTNRIAYFPMMPPCSDPCIKLTAPNGNTINVLHIDQSGGSYDVSMDAYKTLKYGAGWESANTLPEAKWDGVQYEYVSMDQCKDILPDGKLPVIAKSPNKYVECAAAEPQSFWATNTQFYDIDDARCLRGVMQKCEMVPPNNTPTCANGKMAGHSGQMPLTGIDTVVDITAAGMKTPAVRPIV